MEDGSVVAKEWGEDKGDCRWAAQEGLSRRGGRETPRRVIRVTESARQSSAVLDPKRQSV